MRGIRFGVSDWTFIMSDNSMFTLDTIISENIKIEANGKVSIMLCDATESGNIRDVLKNKRLTEVHQTFTFQNMETHTKDDITWVWKDLDIDNITIESKSGHYSDILWNMSNFKNNQ